MIHDHVHLCPGLKLAVPMWDCRQRRNDQEGSSNVISVVDLVQKGDRLNCLSETHFVSHDTGLVIEPTVEQPIESFHLVLTKLVAMLELGRLFQLAERSTRWTGKLSCLSRIWDDLARVELVYFDSVDLQNLIPELPSRTIIGGVAPLDQEEDLYFTVRGRQFSFINDTVDLDSSRNKR